MNIDNTMTELAEYVRMSEEINATIDSLKDSIKEYMLVNNIETIHGSEHKASYKIVNTSRIDTTAIKKDLPDIAAKYTRVTQNKRFTFV